MEEEDKPLHALAVNNFEITCHGGIRMDDCGVTWVGNQGSMGQLLDGSNYFDDVEINDIRNLVNQHVCVALQTETPTLPRDKMLPCIQDRGLKQPTPKQWTKK